MHRLRERDRSKLVEKEGEGMKKECVEKIPRERKLRFIACMQVRVDACKENSVCVCCVCVRERERESDEEVPSCEAKKSRKFSSGLTCNLFSVLRSDRQKKSSGKKTRETYH